MRKLEVLIDLDSTVVHLDKKWYGTWNERTGDDLHPEKVDTWDTHLYCKNQDKAFYQILNEPGFFRDLEPIAGALDAVKHLFDQGHELYIITSSPNGGMHDKKLWVKDHLPFIKPKHVMMVDVKHKVHGDVLIDDAPHNIIDYRKAWPTSLIVGIEYRYNRTNPEVRAAVDLLAKDYREPIKAWAEMVARIEAYASAPRSHRGFDGRLNALFGGDVGC